VSVTYKLSSSSSADCLCYSQVAEPSSCLQQSETVQSHAVLHYSVLKNLAELAQKENDIACALEYYMEVWRGYRLASLSICWWLTHIVCLILHSLVHWLLSPSGV